MPDTSNDMKFMSMALEEGVRGLGFTSPNPPVGCVIVGADGQVIGRGFHAKAGEDHAEAAALKSVKNQSLLKGATAYVTLEPCASEGRTPSCAKTLAGLPLSRVVFGSRDPNPTMAGGQQILQQAGITCDHLREMDRKCLKLAEVFFCNQKLQRSFVHVKVGSSLDGQLALSSGESQWITNEKSRENVQVLRGQADAVLVGRGTFESDNPRLNSRAPGFESKVNAAIIVDPNGQNLNRLNGSRLLEVRPPEKVFVLVREGASIPGDHLFQFVTCPVVGESLDLTAALQELYSRGVTSVFVEGGGTTISRFFEQKLVDRLSVFLAPKVLGAAGGQSWTKDLSIEKLSNAIDLPEWELTQFGSDLCLSSGIFVDAQFKDH